MKNPMFVMFVPRASRENLILTATRLFTQEKEISLADIVRQLSAQNGPGLSMREDIWASSLINVRSVLRSLDKKPHLIVITKCIIQNEFKCHKLK